MFELQCQVLRKDSKMYKDRIEAILQQMEEVAIERDQVKDTWGGQGHRRGCSLIHVADRARVGVGEGVVQEVFKGQSSTCSFKSVNGHDGNTTSHLRQPAAGNPRSETAPWTFQISSVYTWFPFL